MDDNFYIGTSTYYGHVSAVQEYSQGIIGIRNLPFLSRFRSFNDVTVATEIYMILFKKHLIFITLIHYDTLGEKREGYMII